jgi:TPR repeat protein
MKEDYLSESKIGIQKSILKKQLTKNTDYQLGLKHFYGIDCRVNYKEAYEIFYKLYSEKQYNNEILILLGIMNEKGLHIQRSYKNAVQFYKKAAKKGSAKAYYLLAQLAENKILDEEDSSKSYDDVAFEYYKKSANLGYSDSHARIGIIFERGLLSTEKNLSSAYDNFKASVEIDNNPIGLNGLGNAYYNGLIADQNYELAVEYYKRAIHGGNVDAMNNLGICYEYGKGVEQNNDKALEYFLKAKEKNHSEGTANYAILKIKIGIKNNNYRCFSECYKILQSAILMNKNNPEIYYFIGLMYEIGIDLFEDGNIIKNPYLAFLNYKKAAELGYSKAYTKIGVSLFNGIENVFGSNEKASISMLEKAVEKGDKEASSFLNFIKNNSK